LFVMSKCCTFHQKKFLVCVNIPGNKTVSDSDSELHLNALLDDHTTGHSQQLVSLA